MVKVKVANNSTYYKSLFEVWNKEFYIALGYKRNNKNYFKNKIKIQDQSRYWT